MFSKQVVPENDMAQRRSQIDISQKRLAEKVEKIAKENYGLNIVVHWKTIDAIEKRKYIPSLSLSLLISEALNSNNNDIFRFKKKTN